jgi:hypothetical protein
MLQCQIQIMCSNIKDTRHDAFLLQLSRFGARVKTVGNAMQLLFTESLSRIFTIQVGRDFLTLEKP